MAKISLNWPAGGLQSALSGFKSGTLTMASRRKISAAGILATLVFALALLSCGGSSAFKRGLEYEQLKNYDAALQSYEEALSADPDNTKYRLYFERARFQAAMARRSRAASPAVKPAATMAICMTCSWKMGIPSVRSRTRVISGLG